MAEESNQGVGSFTHPSQLKNPDIDSMASISKLLLQYEDMLGLMRREFRGESLYTDPDGSCIWIQTQKPLFTRNNKDGNPLLVEEKNEKGEIVKYKYMPNDDAIDEVLLVLKFGGINKITAITGLDENEIIDDLKEIECKLAGLLTLKQKEWGIDKELLPMRMTEIKTIIKDARYLAKDGLVLKALRSTIQRVESEITNIGSKDKSGSYSSPYK